MSLDATVGGTTANSYVTLAVAQTYFNTRLNTDAWDAADPETQTAALVMACRRLDMERFLGYVVSFDQALQWPRYGVAKRNAWRWFLGTEIPVDVQEAQCELALAFLADGDLMGSGELDGFQSVTLGSMSVTPLRGRTGSLPVRVRRLLSFVLEAGMGTPVIRG